MINPGANLLLKGVVGSQAFGLAHENSDVDYAGVFFVPTQLLFSLTSKVQESYNYKDPDTSYHEVGKYCSLALKCNPSCLDLLFLEEYNVRTQLGTELVNLRSNFLSGTYVRNAYLGYATGQVSRLSHDSRPEKRAKHARHVARLLIQGYQLYSEGTYSVHLSDPEYVKSLGQTAADGDTEVLSNFILTYMTKFNNTKTVLPDKANVGPVQDWLNKVRYEFHTYENGDTSQNMEEFKSWLG